MQPYQMGISDSRWGSPGDLLYPKYEPVPIRSESTIPAGGTGQTFRFTPPENQSMVESNAWSLQNWIGSPQQANMAIPVKVRESQQLAATVEPKKDVIGGSLDWALETSVKAATLYDQVRSALKPREVVSGTPRAGYEEGRDVQHTNDLNQRSAEVISSGKALVSQIKGLFSLGYPQLAPQPAAAVEHEIGPDAPFKVPIIAIIIALLILVYK